MCMTDASDIAIGAVLQQYCNMVQNSDPALQRLCADSSLQLQAMPAAMSMPPFGVIRPLVCRGPTFHPISVAPFSIHSIYRILASVLCSAL